MKTEFNKDIGEEIISKLKELDEVLDDLIRRCKDGKKSPDTPLS